MIIKFPVFSFRTELLLIIVAAALLLFTISACNGSTSPKKTTLFGKVILVNDSGNPEMEPVDYSGVTITVFNGTNMIDGLDEAMSAYPQNGFFAEDNGFIAVQDQQHKYNTVSATDGTFSISDIDNGSWIIKFSKTGWCDRLVRVFVDSNKNEPLNAIMYPVLTVSTSWHGDLILKANHEIMINGDFALLGNLVAEGSGVIRINDQARVSIQGSIINESEELVIFSGFNSETEGYYQIVLIDPEHDVSNFAFINAKTGLLIASNSSLITIKNTLFYNCEAGLRISYGSIVNVENSVFGGCYSLATTTAALNQESNTSLINRNIFIDNGIGLRSANNATTMIEDNLFIGNIVGAESSYQTRDVIRYNTFRNNLSYAIQTASLRSCLIEQNDIDGEGGIRNFWWSTPGQAPQIHDNNIKTTKYAIYTSIQEKPQNVNATMNYFYTTNIEEINQLIWDENDRQIEFPSLSPAGYVLFEPFRTSKVITAGIR